MQCYAVLLPLLLCVHRPCECTLSVVESGRTNGRAEIGACRYCGMVEVGGTAVEEEAHWL